jgi:prepilin-type N-terminal cleavage/methylation domain-containing protein
MKNGYTLIEVIVVLVLLALAAALVAPALATPHDGDGALAGLIGHARALAIRRAEAVELRVEATGAWRLDGLASAAVGPLETGTIAPRPTAAVTLVFSPLGACAPDLATGAAAAALHLEPLMCEKLP